VGCLGGMSSSRNDRKKVRCSVVSSTQAGAMSETVQKCANSVLELNYDTRVTIALNETAVSDVNIRSTKAEIDGPTLLRSHRHMHRL